MTSRFYIIV